MCRTLRIETLVIFQPCMSRDVKPRQGTKKNGLTCWSSSLRDSKSFNPRSPALSFYSISFSISYFLLSLFLVVFGEPSFRSGPCLFSSFLTLLLLSFFSCSSSVRLLASIKVFLILSPTICPTSPPRVSLRLSLPPGVLSFSCGSLGSHALRLYRCLWERRRPAASN